MTGARISDLYCADLFAGGGGFSTGVARACRRIGRTPELVAINHWDIAVKTHARNHPWARHLCTGLEAVLPTEVCPNPKGRLNLLVASPECTHHSNARGGRPMSDQSRASAWLILKWLQELYVESVVIENVQEFADWGPLGADGRPMKRLRGALFDQFIASLKALGYNVEWRVLNAADYGGATTRERLFIQARRGGNKHILWPDATHSPSGKPRYDRRKGGYNWGAKNTWRPAREIIDWSAPTQSIFARKKPLAPATIERIAAGLKKFGGKAAEPFLVVLRRHADARSVNEPLPTLTAGGTHVGLCQPVPFMLGQQSGGAPRSVDQPVPTVAAGGAISLVQPFVISAGGPVGQGRNAKSINEPLPTVLTDDHHALVQPFMFNMQRAQDPHLSIDRPMPTITASSSDYGLVEPYLVEYRGNHAGRDDGHRRVASLDQPLPTQDTSNRFGLCQPFLVSYYGTQNISPVSAPLPTVTTKDRFGLVQCDGYLLDIFFRMLHWRELARAMGFPEDYEFEGTRDQKVRQIGNAVHVDVAEALAMAAVAA